MIDWLITNKEWIFSGVGIAIITVVFSLIFRKRNKSDSNTDKSVSDGIKIQISNVKGNIDISELNNAKHTEVAGEQANSRSINSGSNAESGENIIMIATLEDITKYDTRVRKLISKIVRDELSEEQYKRHLSPSISLSPPTPEEVRAMIEQTLNEIACVDKDRILDKVCNEIIISQRRNEIVDHLKSTILNLITNPTIEDLINILGPENEAQIVHSLEYAGFIQPREPNNAN